MVVGSITGSTYWEGVTHVLDIYIPGEEIDTVNKTIKFWYPHYMQTARCTLHGVLLKGSKEYSQCSAVGRNSTNLAQKRKLAY